MASTIKVFTGGTVGGRDGVAVDAGNPIVLPDDDTPIEVFVRVVDDATGDDTGEDSATTLSPSVPAGLLACFTVGGTYASAPTADAFVACGGNRSLFLKRDGNPAPDIYDLTLGAESFVAGTRPAQVGTITPTAGVGSVALDWADVASATGYEIDYGADNTFATKTRVTSATSDKTITGLTPGATYYFRARATNANGVGAWSAAASAASLAWSDDFSDNSIDTNKWFTRVQDGGAVSESGGNLVINTTAANAQLALVSSKLSCKGSSGESTKLTVDGVLQVGSIAEHAIAEIHTVSEPTFGAVAADSLWLTSIILVNADPTGNTSVISYWSDTGTRYFWTGSAWSTTTTKPTYAWDAGDTFTVEFEITATQWRVILKEGANTVLTTDWVNHSATRGTTGAWYLAQSDNSAAQSYNLSWSNVALTAL